MAEYTATQDYRSTISVAGSNKVIAVTEGDVLELDDDEFAAVERDAPGTLVESAAKKPAAKKAPAKKPAAKKSDEDAHSTEDASGLTKS